MLSDPAPRPPRSYDPAVAPHRDDDGIVHVHDYPTIRGLLRDANRVTADVTDMLTPEQRDRVHPVSAFVWATDRKTISGCPGRHGLLRATMAPWFTASMAVGRQGAARATCERLVAAETGGPFDLYDDYAMPLVVSYLSDWLGIPASDVTYAVEDQLAAGEFFDDWPLLASAEMDEHYRALMGRPDLGGVAAAVRDLLAEGVVGEREAWGILYSISVSSVATAASITLAIGLSVEHQLWHRMVDVEDARAAVEEAVRLGNPFPQASRFVREPFTLGEVAVRPGDQVLMWLTAANRDLPGPHREPLDRFDPWRDHAQHLGWGSGYHLCAGVHHARTLAATAVTTLAEHCPNLGIAGPWKRFVGIDDGYLAAPVVAGAE
jgi:cytochrome P450